jgi:hypothetical protein
LRPGQTEVVEILQASVRVEVRNPDRRIERMVSMIRAERAARLQAVVRRLIAQPHPHVADCAAEFGFTDQTHDARIRCSSPAHACGLPAHDSRCRISTRKFVESLRRIAA